MRQKNTTTPCPIDYRNKKSLATRRWILDLLFICSKRAVAHAARGRDGRQEGRERGYYHLHRNLNHSLLHTSPPFLR